MTDRASQNAGRRSINLALHYWFAISGLLGSFGAFAITCWAYYDETMGATHIAFACVAVVDTVLFFAFMWGCLLLMQGLFPRKRSGWALGHSALGCVTPLTYTLWISAQLAGSAHIVGDLELTLSFWSMVAVILQFVTGWGFLRRGWPLRLHT